MEEEEVVVGVRGLDGKGEKAEQNGEKAERGTAIEIEMEVAGERKGSFSQADLFISHCSKKKTPPPQEEKTRNSQAPLNQSVFLL